MVTTKGFVSVKLTPEIETGDEVKQKNAGGEICVSAKNCDLIKWWTVETEFCQVDPDLLGIVAPSWPKVLDNTGDAVGFRITSDTTCDTGYALEVWSDIENGTSTCDDPTVPGQWGYTLIPWLTGTVPSDITIGADAVDLSVRSTTRLNSKWGKGPHSVVMNGTTTPVAGPLIANIAANEQVHMQMTTVAPPAPLCGCQALP
jgi:hypothetical protein